MIPPSEPLEEHPARTRRRRGGWSLRLTPAGLLLILLLDLLVLALVNWSLLQSKLAFLPSLVRPTSSNTAPSTVTLTATSTSSPTPTATSIPATQAPASADATPTQAVTFQQGLIILALSEGNHTHLFAYQPQVEATNPALPLARLTEGPWDDVQPALSPDGNRVAFASNRNGYWDIYVLDLTTGLVSRLTDSLEYDGSPSWSPDGVWIVFETYVSDNLEIMIRSTDPAQAPIRLTTNPAADSSPAWSPQGRRIAFVSDRSGEPEIWLIDLDKADETLFMDISQDPDGIDAHPAWSKDGRYLAWSAVQGGFHNIYSWDSTSPGVPARLIGSGDWPVWSPDGSAILAGLFAPNRHYLTAYPAGLPGVVLPPLALPGLLQGLDWGPAALAYPLQEPFKEAAAVAPTPIWLPALTPMEGTPTGRRQVVQLKDVQAPYAFLHDFVDESFQSLRQQVSLQVGWDYLSTLENAYVPLTTALEPGMETDWLYTGRAFALTTQPMNAGWLMVVREDFGQQTYWRVFVRARFQDGSSGRPLTGQPWDFSSRYSGDTTAYEWGGKTAQDVPPGYWLDLTSLALDYGWERLPALASWRSSFNAARFNEFAYTAGLNWQEAMLELYPPEALLTPTPLVPPTRTPTPTPRWYQTPTPTQTPTPRPTLTPLPTEPPTVTPTATSTPTPAPASTSTRTPTPSPTPSPTLTPTPHG